MLNYVQRGDRLAIYNPSSTVTMLAGVPVVVSGHIRIPIANIPPLSSGEGSAEDVFNLPAKSADTWNDGDNLFWDATNGCLTVTAAGNAYAGVSAPLNTGGVGPPVYVYGKASGVTSANVAVQDHNEIVTLSGVSQQAAPATAAAITAVMATPTGGTGATAGAFDTAAHRDALIATVTALVADVTALRAEIVARDALLLAAGVT